MSVNDSQTGTGTARCTGASDCPATEHVFGCYAGPGWAAEPGDEFSCLAERGGRIRDCLAMDCKDRFCEEVTRG